MKVTHYSFNPETKEFQIQLTPQNKNDKKQCNEMVKEGLATSWGVCSKCAGTEDRTTPCTHPRNVTIKLTQRFVLG